MTHMWNTMKTFIVFAVTLSVVFADSSPQSATESTNKAEPKNANSIPVVPQKPQTYYTHVPQRNPYITYIQKPYYMPQQPAQPTMVIIAQPALVPQHLIYSHAAQQLLHYFQNNPQARYQFLNGYQPQPQPQPQPAPQGYTQQAAQTYVAPQIAHIPYPTASPSYANYQYVPQPQYIAAPQHVAFAHSPFHSLPANYLAQAQTQAQTQTQVHSQTPAQTQIQPQTHAQPQPQPQAQAPVSLSSISNYATLAAQQYTHQAPIKTVPPIITGFENFTPEQQAQIKEQLSSHFGAPLTHLNGNSLQVPNQQFGVKVNSPTENSHISNDNKEAQSQQANNNYYRNQYPNKQ